MAQKNLRGKIIDGKIMRPVGFPAAHAFNEERNMVRR
jgi:hypothetical protein